MKLLKRTEFGNPILRAKAKKVSLRTLQSASFKNLVKDMIFTMREVGGVGIAAPQVGKSLQLAVMEMRPTKTRPKLKKKGPIVVINPRIVKRSKSRNTDWEGCLSFEGVRGRVPRPTAVVVEYTNEMGKKVRESASGLWAKIYQHEIDHLNGVTYTDHIEDMTSLITLDEFRKRVLKKKK